MPSITPQTGLLSAREVAEQLSISTTAVYALCESGQLPAYRIGAGQKKRLRIAPESVVEFLERSRVSPAVETVKPRRADRIDKGGFELLRKAGWKG